MTTKSNEPIGKIGSSTANSPSRGTEDTTPAASTQAVVKMLTTADEPPMTPRLVSRSPEGGALIKYDAARLALSNARSVDEVREIRDTAEAMRAYAHQAKNRELELDAAEIRVRAERRLGEMIGEQKKTVGLASGSAGRGKQGAMRGTLTEPRIDAPPTLAEAGIDKKLSAASQKLAAVPEKLFEKRLIDAREKMEVGGDRISVAMLRGDHVSQIKQKQADVSPKFHVCPKCHEACRICRAEAGDWPRRRSSSSSRPKPSEATDQPEAP